MRLSKNTFTLLLMICSITLVLVLQFFWLRSLYQDTRDNFSQETGLLFERTVMDMQYSLFQENIELLPEDSLFTGQDSLFIGRHASGHPESKTVFRRAPTLTAVPVIRGSDSVRRATVFGADSGDRDDRLSLAISSGGEGIVSFRFNPHDTLSVADIEARYDSVLTEAGIDIPFNVLYIPLRSDYAPPGRMLENRLKLFKRLAPRRRIGGAVPAFRQFPEDSLENWEKTLSSYTSQDNSLVVGHVPLPPGSVAAARFTDYKWMLFRKMTPQLLFSLLTVLFISISFYFMYRSLRMQQRLMQLKNEFVSNVTHELNTPIATVSSAIEALRNFSVLDNPSRTRDYLEIAQQELGRLTLLSDKILKAMILEHHERGVSMEKIDVNEIIREVLASLKLVFKKKQAQVTFETTGEDFSMKGEKASVMNVVYNLLDNALKYSSGTPRISISLKEQSGGLLLDICDQGIGIPPEFHGKVFEKFFRVPRGDVHNIKGYGLGLNYVDGVIKNHGGTIRLESRAGGGSVFSVYLPKEKATAGGT